LCITGVRQSFILTGFVFFFARRHQLPVALCTTKRQQVERRQVDLTHRSKFLNLFFAAIFFARSRLVDHISACSSGHSQNEGDGNEVEVNFIVRKSEEKTSRRRSPKTQRYVTLGVRITPVAMFAVGQACTSSGRRRLPFWTENINKS
jgi:hypothetical protein